MARSFGVRFLAPWALLLVTMPAVAQGVAEVQISPPTVSLGAGQQQGVFATAYDASGNVVPTATFTWSSTSPQVARVEPDASAPGVALVIGVAPGIAQIEARVGNRVGTAAVQVIGGPGGVTVEVGTGPASSLRIEPANILLLPSEQRQLIPVFLKDDGSLAAPQAVTWTSLNPAIATVNASGLVIALSDGQAAISATTQSGLQAVSPVAVERNAFSFRTPVLSLSPGQEATIEIIVPSQGGRTIPNTALTWRSSNQSVVGVTQAGLARAVAAGSAQITAGGYLQEQTVDVRVHRPVTELRVLPRPSAGPVVVPFNGELAFEITALAGDGTPVPEAPMAFSVADTTIAAFDDSAMALRGLQLGTTRLHLTGPGPDILEVDWDVQVVAGGLVVSPLAAGMGVRDTLMLDAQFTDSTGTPISRAAGHTWSSSDEAVAQVTGSGLVTAVGHGHAAIIASTSWGAADTANLYVQGELIYSSTRSGSADIWAVDRDALGSATQVTTHADAEVAGAYSPDGSQIVFVSTRDGNPDLFVVNADGSGEHQLTQTPGPEDAPAWTPDGRSIVFSASEPGSRMQVSIMNADGTGRRELTTGDATNFQPAVSPDGSTIAFTSTRDGNYEIYLMAADGSEQRNVTQAPGKEGTPQWFPDGTLGYLAEQRSGASIQSVTMRQTLTSGAVARLSPEGLMVTDFAVSPDGQTVALEISRFAGAGGILRRVFLMPVAGGTPIELPTASADEQQSSPGWR